MPIDFACAKCGRETSAPEEFAGKKGRCGGCGEVLVIPPPNYDLPVLVPKAAPRPSPPVPAPIQPTPIATWAADPQFQAQPPARTSPPPMPVRTCGFCGERIQPTALKCRHCGETLDPALRSAEEAKRMAEMASRSHAGNVIISNNLAASSSSGRRRRPRRDPWIAFLGLCLATAGILFLLFILSFVK